VIVPLLSLLNRSNIYMGEVPWKLGPFYQLYINIDMEPYLNRLKESIFAPFIEPNSSVVLMGLTSGFMLKFLEVIFQLKGIWSLNLEWWIQCALYREY